MKKILSLLVFFFLLVMATNVYAQIERKVTNVKPPTVQSVDLNKVNPDLIQPDMADLKSIIVRHFNNVKVGTPTQQKGASELMVVDRLFPVLNTTNITTKGKTKEPRVVTVTQNLDINVNVKEFAHFSENADSWLKPGQIITAQSFLGGQPLGVTTPRNPISLTINLPGVANRSQQVLNPDQNPKLRTAEDYLITQSARLSAPGLSFSFHKIHSVEEMELTLTGKYRGVLKSFSNKVGLREGNQQFYHYYLLEFRQNMFSIQADELSPYSIFKQPVNDMTSYVYIDKVDYGRSSIIIFKSTRTLEELGITAAANYPFGLSEEKMRTTYQQLSAKPEVTVFARFYGGSSAQEILSMENTVKNGVPDIFTFIRSQPNDHRLALPVGYTLKNTNNQLIGQKTNKTQSVTTKTPAPPPSIYKLRVTLTDIQNIKGRDGGSNPDDYGIQQYIAYSALGKDKEFVSRRIKTFPHRIDLPGQVPYIINPLIKGDMNNQIHAKENADLKKRDRNMINNSLVFHITPDELNDPDAVFVIFTWLKEYTSNPKFIGKANEDRVLLNNKPVKVKIKDIVEILYGLRSLKENTTFPNADIGKGAKFHSFGPDFLRVANIQKKTSLVLEGPIPIVYAEAVVAVWMQFELLD